MSRSPLSIEKYSCLLLLLLTLLLGGCRSGNFRVLEGEWTNRDKDGQETRLVFGPGARFRAIATNGVKADGTYWEDFRQNPPWLDLKFSDGSIVQTVVKLKDQTLEVQTVKPGDPRPKTFSADVVVYTKAEPIILKPSPASGSRRRR